MLRVKRLFGALLVLVSSPAFSQPTGGIECVIRFYDKTIYRLGDEIQVEFTITNNSTDTFAFKMADSKAFSFGFTVTTPTALELPHSQQFTIERSADQPLFYRELSLEPGEKYGVVLGLGRFIRIEESGIYTVQGSFFPGLDRGETPTSIRSNTLALSVRPAAESAAAAVMLDAETGALLERASLPPDQVIAYMLDARRAGQWDKFFLYLDLEGLYTRDPARQARYQRASREDRQLLLQQFRQSLMRQQTEQEILLVPSSYEIQKTTYDRVQARVVAAQSFAYRGYVEWKRYSYSLRRDGSYWLVTDYDIQNLGTE